MRARIRTVIPTKIEVAVYEELASLRSPLSREEVRTPSGQVERTSFGICLAGSVLDNLQGFGLGQTEQLFEELGGGPELLAASL